jgi:hypothetical protein
MQNGRLDEVAIFSSAPKYQRDPGGRQGRAFNARLACRSIRRRMPIAAMFTTSPVERHLLCRFRTDAQTLQQLAISLSLRIAGSQ